MPPSIIVVEILFYITLVHKNVKFYYIATPIFFLFSIKIYLDAFQQENISLWYQNYFATAIFFLLGSLLTIFSKRFKIRSSPTIIYTTTGLFFVVFFAAPIGNPIGSRWILFQTVVFSTLGVILLSLIYCVTGKHEESEFSKFLGKLAYPIYVGHIFCIGILNVFGVAILSKYDLSKARVVITCSNKSAQFPKQALS